MTMKAEDRQATNEVTTPQSLFMSLTKLVQNISALHVLRCRRKLVCMSSSLMSV